MTNKTQTTKINMQSTKRKPSKNTQETKSGICSLTFVFHYLIIIYLDETFFWGWSTLLKQI